MVGTLIEHQPTAIKYLADRYRQGEEGAGSIVAIGDRQAQLVVSANTGNGFVEDGVCAQGVNPGIGTGTSMCAVYGPQEIEWGIGLVFHQLSVEKNTGLQVERIVAHNGILRLNARAGGVNAYLVEQVIIIIAFVFIAACESYCH